MTADPRAVRRALAPRWLAVTHRYLGVAMGLLMLVWFVSGLVMLFVRWPEVTPEQRAAGLEPIPWSKCCDFGPTQDVQVMSDATVESLDGRPVLRFDDGVVDLATGQPLAPLSAGEALRVARAFAAANRVAGTPVRAAPVDRDQWTVTGYFDKDRPFWKVRLSQGGADVYVSARTGKVAQVTDARTRLLNWFGPIPHWLYPQVLRQDVKLWTHVVVWTSVLGVFLTLTGLYLGAVAFRAARDRRMSPFRGWMAWHHLTGLFAGVLTLTWVASGLVSMNPWGFLEGKPDDTPARISGDVTFGDLRSAVLAAQASGIEARRVVLAPLAGRVFLMADGVRLDARGKPAVLTTADLAAAGAVAGKVASQGMMSAEDAYYHSGHEGAVPLPVWRVVLDDGTRIYLDPASGQVRARFDAERRAYRWLFEGLHRLDFVPGFDRGPVWVTAVIALLAAAGTGVATGVWLGWRRARIDMARLRRSSGTGGHAEHSSKA